MKTEYEYVKAHLIKQGYKGEKLEFEIKRRLREISRFDPKKRPGSDIAGLTVDPPKRPHSEN